VHTLFLISVWPSFHPLSKWDRVCCTFSSLHFVFENVLLWVIQHSAFQLSSKLKKEHVNNDQLIDTIYVQCSTFSYWDVKKYLLLMRNDQEIKTHSLPLVSKSRKHMMVLTNSSVWQVSYKKTVVGVKHDKLIIPHAL
jgi:hypothetical protein